MVDKLKKHKVIVVILLLAIMVFISIKRIQTYNNNNYITKKEEVFLPIEGVIYVSRNTNSYVRVFTLTDDDTITHNDLSMWNINACHPNILIGKQIKYVKYTYYYGDIKYQAISTIFDSYCNENANLLKN